MSSMRKILFLVGYYYPKAMANGICVGELAKELKKRQYDVHVICLQNDGDRLEDNIEGVCVHRISPSLYRTIELKRNTDSKKNNSILRLLTLGIKLAHIPFYPITSFTQIKRYIKAAEKIIKNENAVVISCFNPMEAIVAGMRLKKKGTHIINIGYYLDSLSNEGDVGIIPKNIREKLGLKWEYKLFNVSDGILLLQSHKRHYCSPKYEMYKNKIRYVDIPLFLEDRYISRNCSRRIVYTGMLSVERRNPDYACSILKNVYPMYSIEFYGRGDCDYILEKYSAENGGNVINKGFVSHAEALKAIEDAEILLSIGNKDSDMIPSKIFEYISTGKSIIHFAYGKCDACIPYLNKYANGLVIYMDDDMSESIKKCEDFISKINNKQNIGELKEAFYHNSPQYSVELLEQMISK